MVEKITFFRSYYEAIKDLPAELQAEVYSAIFEYSFEDQLPELSPVAGAIFKLIAPVIDKGKQIQEKAKENGSKGGRPKQNQQEETINQQEETINQQETEIKPTKNQKETKKKPNENQTKTEITETETQTKTGKGIGIGKGIGEGIGIGEGTGKRKKEKEMENNKGPDGLLMKLRRSGLSPDILPAVTDYADMRKKIKAALTDRALDLMLTKLKILSSDPAEQIEILNQSTMNSWKGIFPLKAEAQPKNKAAEDLDAFYKMTAKWAESEGA